MSAAAHELLRELRARGVTAQLRGTDLSLRPAAALDPGLLERVWALKGELVGLLEALAAVGPPDPWREESIEACRRRLLDAAELIREFARSRWGEEADRWPVELLAGFYAADLLPGLEAALGPWEGWDALRRRLERQTGPTAIARLWSAYAALAPEKRAHVVQRRDRTQSPPGRVSGGARA